MLATTANFFINTCPCGKDDKILCLMYYITRRVCDDSFNIIKEGNPVLCTPWVPIHLSFNRSAGAASLCLSGENFADESFRNKHSSLDGTTTNALHMPLYYLFSNKCLWLFMPLNFFSRSRGGGGVGCSSGLLYCFNTLWVVSLVIS